MNSSTGKTVRPGGSNVPFGLLSWPGCSCPELWTGQAEDAAASIHIPYCHSVPSPGGRSQTLCAALPSCAPRTSPVCLISLRRSRHLPGDGEPPDAVHKLPFRPLPEKGIL